MRSPTIFALSKGLLASTEALAWFHLIQLVANGLLSMTGLELEVVI